MKCVKAAALLALLIASGDPVQDRSSSERFLQQYYAAHSLEDNAADAVTLTVARTSGHSRFRSFAVMNAGASTALQARRKSSIDASGRTNLPTRR